MDYRTIEECINQKGMGYEEYLNKFINEIAETNPGSLDEKAQ